VTTPPDSRLLTMDSAAVLALACVTGLFGASAYWLIAGRNAGIRASRIDQNQPAP
jgi:hypothetical protein